MFKASHVDDIKEMRRVLVKKTGFLTPKNRSYSPCTIGYRFYHKICFL